MGGWEILAVVFGEYLNGDLECASPLMAGGDVPMLSEEGIELVEGE